MSKWLNSPTLSPTLKELMRRGDKAMAEARVTIIESRQMVKDARMIRQAVEDGELSPCEQ